MFRNKFIALVVPAYNEARHITQVVHSAPDLVDLLVVVDDGSQDATADIIQGISDPRVTLLRHTENRGVGAAIVTGYRFAMEQGADIVGVVGGDGQMDTAHLPALLDPIISGGCDFAKGNRLFSWRSWRGMPLHRAIGNVILSALTKPASGYWHVFDAQNGFTMISSSMLRRLPLSRLETGYQFENLLLIHLNLAGAVVTDVPIPARYGEEESGIRLWRDVPIILWTLVRGFMLRTRQTYLKNARSVAGIVLASGSMLATLGLGLTLWTWIATGASWVSLAAKSGLLLGGLLIYLFFLMDIRASRRFRHPRELPSIDERPVRRR